VEWPILLAGFFLALLLLLLLRVPVIFSLFTASLVAAIAFFGLLPALRQLVLSIYSTTTTFTLVPILLFVMMGEVLFRSGVAEEALRTLDELMGRIPGRLALVTTAGGTLFAVLSGSTVAATAVLGTTFLPQMIRQNYPKRLAFGSIAASGGLAMVIPPSGLAIIWGATANVPVGPLFIGGVIPGLLMATGYALISITWGHRAKLREERRSRETPQRRMRAVAVNVLPLGLIVFLVLGLIFLGLATPTESAALGAVGAVVLAAFYRRLEFKMLLDAFERSVVTTSMILLLLSASGLYSQVLSFSGGSRGLAQAMTSLDASPIVVLILMQVIVQILSLVLDEVSIILITVPLFMPIVTFLGWDPLWFSIVMLIGLNISLLAPPFSIALFVMKGIAPPGTQWRDIYIGIFPYLLSDATVMTLIIVFPAVATWLPGLMAV
jgi:tripartite ATP-independent transporter DctM subunit